MTTLPTPLEIRDCVSADIPCITAIYAHWVQHGLASFELEAPDDTEMLNRFRDITQKGYPYIVAIKDNQIAGYAYASAYRTRPAYRFACENSIYIAPEYKGQGIGKTLLQKLIDLCTERHFRAMIAVIGDSKNHASIALHRAFDFQDAGILPNVGWKHGQWVDSISMILPLGAGASKPPEE